MTKFRIWLLASRPKTLPAAIMPVLLGTACAMRGGAIDGWIFACVLCSAMAIQIGTNFANDFADFKSGADTSERLGPTRVTQAGLLSPGAVKVGANVAFLLAFLCGIPLMLKGGWPIVAIGLAGISCGWAYTSGPYPLGYNGLGELAVMLFFGFAAVMGTAYLLTGAWSALSAVVSVVPACHAAALLAANNLRDLDTDAAAGKHTLAVRFGRTFARWEFAVLLLLPFAVPLYLVSAEPCSAWLLLPLLTMPVALRATLIASRAGSGLAIIPVFRLTALLLASFGLLFTVGLIVA